MKCSPSLFRYDSSPVERNRLLRRGDFTGRRLLEIGCGDGRLTGEIAGEAGYLCGVDPDLAALHAAQKTRPHSLTAPVDFCAAPAESLPLAGRRFDFVLFSWSF